PKANQIRVPPSSTDCRRGHIDLRRARRGLKAEDPLPNGIITQLAPESNTTVTGTLLISQ
ncbi:6576_t:CDS:2, partial [Acaulospora morrowiae]